MNDGFVDIEEEQYDESIGYREAYKSSDVIAQEIYDRLEGYYEVPEKSFIKSFYVIEDLNASPVKINNIDNIGEAIKEYESLPNDKIKALGIESRTGALDFVQCINGQDKLVQDYKKLGNWNDSVEIFNAAKNIQFHFAKKAAEKVYEATQSNIQINEMELEV